MSLYDSPALEEGDVQSWVGLLAGGEDRALDSIVHAVDPHARCVADAPTGGARLSWRVVLDDVANAEQPEVGVARLSTGADFRFDAPGEVAVQLSPR